MIEIEQDDYRAVAVALSDAIGGREFFCGSVEYRCDSFYSTLTATLIVHHSEPRNAANNQSGDEVYDLPEVNACPLTVVPVWWEFTTTLPDGGKTLNDFSFSDLTPFLTVT